MFDLNRSLNALKQKPEEERVAIAFLGALIVAGLIFLVWASIFFFTLRGGNSNQLIKTQPKESDLEKTVNAIINDDSYNPLPEYEVKKEDLPLQLIEENKTSPGSQQAPQDVGTYSDL